MMLKFPIYLDHNATTPVDPEVLKAMLPYFTEIFGNAASRHHEFGWTAEAAVERARSKVAALMGAQESEVIFTSGGTESNNLALQGVCEEARSSGRGKHLLVSPTEHRSIIDTAGHLAKTGFEVDWLQVNPHGQVDPRQIAERIRPDTVLVSVMAANNEIGSINPLVEIGEVCKKMKTLFHTDAVQAWGKIPLDVEKMGIDLMSVSGHKIYGPKGVGALYVRRKKPRVQMRPLFFGGLHERGLRAGTLNVPGIVGMGRAAELSLQRMADDSARILRLREALWNGIKEGLDGVELNGSPAERLAGNLNLSFEGVDGEALMMGMRELAVSSGSACTSDDVEPSHVLLAIGLSEDQARGSIRFGLGRGNTEEEIQFSVEKVVETVKKLRSLSPLANAAFGANSEERA